MKRVPCVVVTIIAIFALASCGGGTQAGGGPSAAVSLSNTFSAVTAGTDAITIFASVSGSGGGQGVAWHLSIGGASCSPSCGTLKPDPAPSMSAVYTPPKQVSANETVTISAQAIVDPTQVSAFSFQIQPTIRVTIADPFAAVTPGGAITDIHAGVENDTTNAGVNWSLTSVTSIGPSCSPECGTLVVDSPQSLTAHYQPPATAPTGAAAIPVITATSVAAPTNFSSFLFTIGAPTVSVAIANKFSGLLAGDPTITVNAIVPNDVGKGVTWSLTAAGATCSPDCGTLTESGIPSLSAKYAPPKTLPIGDAANPTITATSLLDTTKSDSFTFTITTASSILNGHYAFQLRGYNASGTAPVAIAGAFVADGAGGITNAEFDSNNGKSVTNYPAPLGGVYEVDPLILNGIPRVTITLASKPASLVLKATISSDGKLGQIIEVDDSGFLTSGTLIQQDPAALAMDPGGNYAFGVDSDAPVGQRIVEAGQFILGAGGKNIAGGLADAIQFSSANPVAGGVNGAAAISAGMATAPDSFGRGTMKLNVGGTGDVQYSYYLVDGQRLNLVEIDGGIALNSVFSGTAQRQIGLDSNSINSTGIVALTGINLLNGTAVPDTAIGVLTIGGTTAMATYDRNTGSSVSTLQQVSGSIGSAGFDPSTGRVLVANTIVAEMALYYYDAGKAYAIDISPNSASHALSGQLMPRTPGRFSATTDLSGNVIGRAGGSSTAAPPNADFSATFDGNLNYSVVLDLTSVNASPGSNGQTVSTSDTFVIDDLPAGHGVFRLVGAVLGDPNAMAVDNVSFYLIGPKQFVAIGNKTGLPSGVMVFNPKDPL